ncbi:hypothetical protein ACVI1L_004728 [Bradyrhizobium sp. USDA 4516]
MQNADDFNTARGRLVKEPYVPQQSSGADSELGTMVTGPGGSRRTSEEMAGAFYQAIRLHEFDTKKRQLHFDPFCTEGAWIDHLILVDFSGSCPWASACSPTRWAGMDRGAIATSYGEAARIASSFAFRWCSRSSTSRSP